MLEGKGGGKSISYRDISPYKGYSVLSRDENSCALGVFIDGREV